MAGNERTLDGGVGNSSCAVGFVAESSLLADVYQDPFSTACLEAAGPFLQREGDAAYRATGRVGQVGHGRRIPVALILTGASTTKDVQHSPLTLSLVSSV